MVCKLYTYSPTWLIRISQTVLEIWTKNLHKHFPNLPLICETEGKKATTIASPVTTEYVHYPLMFFNKNRHKILVTIVTMIWYHPSVSHHVLKNGYPLMAQFTMKFIVIIVAYILLFIRLKYHLMQLSV